MPNRVVNVQKRALSREPQDEGELLSIQDIRTARILYGMPTIDDNGDVTGEIVPIPDSYHFLSAARRGEVIHEEREITAELDRIISEALKRYVRDFAMYKRNVESLAAGNVTRSYVESKIQDLKFEEHISAPLFSIIDEASKLSYLAGHRDSILTPMEMMLLGRTPEQKYFKRTYTPLGVQDGPLDVSTANKLRGEERFFLATTDLFNGYDYPFAFSLEPLNGSGETERGPAVLRAETREPLSSNETGHLKTLQKEIPFSRPTEWYHKEKE